MENVTSLRRWLQSHEQKLNLDREKNWLFRINYILNSNGQWKDKSILQNKPFQEALVHRCKVKIEIVCLFSAERLVHVPLESDMPALLPLSFCAFQVIGSTVINQTYCPPKSCIPSRANTTMKRNSRKSKLMMDFMEFSKETTRFLREFQYLCRRSEHRNH